MLILLGSCVLIKFVYQVVFYFIIIHKWTLTKGEITIVDSTVVQNGEESGWEKKITYSYKVGEQIFESSTITKNIIILLPFKDWADSTFKNFKRGQIIDVKYNPKKPSVALIDLEFDINNILFLIVSVASFLFAFFL